ncbi:MAG: DnaD domain protein [Lachnospiraceae bacterium]
METITISTKNHETYSAVSNFFIDYYMTDANGEFVKVYLYLVRLLHSGKSLTISDIADHFNLTQKDICRAIKYWIKEGVLQLEYNSDNTLTGITLLPLSPKESKQEDDSLLSMLGIKPKDEVVKQQQSHPDSQEEAVTSEISSTEDEADEMVTVPEKVKYKATFIEDKKTNDEDFANLVFQIETYFARPLTQADFNSILYIYNELSFSADLLEYLVEHCVTLGKKSCRYIEAVAIDWYKSGIQTVADAKAVSNNYNSIYTSVLKALGIPRHVATPEEIEYIDTWYNEFSFNKNIILEACKRAISNNPHSPSFHYVNGILKSWHKQNVHKLSDIEVLDKQWAEEKKKKEANYTKKNSSQIEEAQRSISDATLDEMEQLIMNQAGKKTGN